MKIAFVYDTAFPWVTGGAERRIYEIGKRLVKIGHEVHIFSLGYWMLTDEHRYEDTIKYDGIIYHSIGKPVDLYTKDNTRSIKEALYFSRKVLSNCNFKGFDIVDCQGFPYFSCYTSKIRTLNSNAKLVITLHEVWNDYWYEYMGRKGFFGKIIEKGIFHLTDNIICVSSLTKRNLLKNHNPENVETIGNGVDIKKITYINPSDKFSDVLFAGRLIPEKHVELLIKAMKIVVNKHHFIKCYIVGNGPMEVELKQLARAYDLESNIIFEDFYENQDDVYAMMKSTTVLVLPSEREGFGIVTIEANSCGVPVVTLDSPMNASVDLVKYGNGSIVNYDAEELAEKINYYIEEGLNRELRNNCREFAKNYDWDIITRKTENYYMQIINDN